MRVNLSRFSLLLALLIPLIVQGQQQIAPPQPPRLVVSGTPERPVALRSVKVDAEVAGGIAVTRIEMMFFNPNRRVLEGELQFPLLDGQAITGFALDIDGKLRDAVPVERARGQAVFEDITRVRIDPGLLQATQGNNFKLRVYPLLAGGTRTVVIRYSEPLNGRYRLPRDYTELETFSMRVRLGAKTVHSVERQNYSAQGVYELPLAAPRGPVVHTQEFNGKAYFYAEVPMAAAKAPRRAPKVVALAWDSSGSGATRDHAKEFALLDAYFRWMKNGEVLLVRLRDAAEPAQRFTIAEGDWRSLRRALESTVYDGATNLGSFALPPAVEETLLFSDGLTNFGAQRVSAGGKPLYAVSAATRSDPAFLRGLAEASGGCYLDLLAEQARDATEKLTHQWERVGFIEGDGVEQIVRESAYPSRGRIALAGVLRGREAKLRIEIGKRVVQVPVRAAAQSGAIAAGLWARLRVAELESEYEFNRAEILRVGKGFGIVTRETSLIVLDRVEDYVRHDIVPPQELRADYERLMKVAVQRRQADRTNHLERIVKLFQQKQAWWAKEFPKDAPALSIARDEREARAPMEGVLRQDRASAAGARPSAPAMSAPLRMAEQAKAQAVAAQSGISIQLKPWQPDAPYARRMRESDARNLYRVYLDEKPSFASSTAFFLDVADLLFEKGQPELALRVLSNLAEMDLENRHILRILGYRLLQAGRPALAVPVFAKVLELAPEEPQSWRDFGLALAADKQNQKAVDALYEVVTRPWHGRFPEVELIALSELNAIAATCGEKLDLARIDPRLIKNLPLDLGAVLTWDADNTDIDLWVTDPNGEKAFYGRQLTYQGGRMSQDFTGGYGPEEFSLRNAKAGSYRIEAQFYGHRQQIVAPATTLQVKLVTHFGTPQAKERIVTLRLKGAA